MIHITINSSALPSIGDSMKECINLGEWLLFKAKNTSSPDPYYLKTDSSLFKLDSSGGLAQQIFDSIDTLGIRVVFYFEGFNHPVSLTNSITLK